MKDFNHAFGAIKLHSLFRYYLFYLFPLVVIPISYYSVFNVRLIACFSVLFLFPMFFSKFRPSIDMLLATVMLLMVLVFSLVTGKFSKLCSVSVFFLILYSFSFISRHTVNEKIIFRAIFMYVLGAMLTSIYVLSQFFLLKFFSIHLGSHTLMGNNRSAYSGGWNDLSFLSLYLASCLPLIFMAHKKYQCIASPMVVLAAIFLVSARTGLAGLLLALLFFVLFSKNAKISLPKKAWFLFWLCLCILAITRLYEEIRATTLFTGTGRLKTFHVGLKTFLDDPLFGYQFDFYKYGSVYGATPHNLFIYMLTMGGIIFFTVFFTWLYFIRKRLTNANSHIVVSCLTVFFGLQFVPSPFSGYFIAWMLGLFMLAGQNLSYQINQTNLFSTPSR